MASPRLWLRALAAGLLSALVSLALDHWQQARQDQQEQVQRAKGVRQLQDGVQSQLQAWERWVQAVRQSAPSATAALQQQAQFAPPGLLAYELVEAGPNGELTAFANWTAPGSGSQLESSPSALWTLLRQAQRAGKVAGGTVAAPAGSVAPETLRLAWVLPRGWAFVRVDLSTTLAPLAGQEDGLAFTLLGDFEGAPGRLLSGQPGAQGTELGLRLAELPMRLRVAQRPPSEAFAVHWAASGGWQALLLGLLAAASVGAFGWRDQARHRQAGQGARLQMQRGADWDLLPEAVLLLGPEAAVHDANDCARRSLRLAEKPDLMRQLIGGPELERALRERLAWAGELAFGPTGSCFDGALSLPDEQGLQRLTLHDAGQRAQAYEQLRLELRAHEVAQRAVAAHVAICTTDQRGRILDVNARWVDLSGFDRELQIGAEFSLHHGEGAAGAAWVNRWAELQAGRAWQSWVGLRRRDAAPYWLALRAQPQFDAQGRLERCVLAGVDVSAPQLQQRELQEQRDRLSAIVEGMQAGTWEWAYQTGGLHVNRRFLALMGELERQDLDLSWAQWRERVHPEDRDRLQQAVNQHLTGQAPLFELELRLPREGGRWAWAELRGAVVQTTPGGAALVLAGTLIDHDASRRQQEAMRVRRLIAERTERLAQVGGFELRLSDNELTWTDQCFALHELSPGAQPTLEQALNYVHPEDRAQLTEAIARSVQEAQGWDLEARLRTALGRELWVRVVGEAEYDDSGPLRVVGAYQDIGQRRALEVETERQQQLLRSVLANLPCGLSVFDGDQRLVAHNDTLLQLLELPPGLMREGQTNYQDLLEFNASRGEYGEGDAQARAIERLQQLALDPVLHHFERQRPSGITLDIRGAPLPGGGLITTYTDISERKRAEEAMRAQEGFLRLVADSVPGRIAYWTRSGRCVFANRAYAQWVGMTPERLLGMSGDDLQHLPWLQQQLDWLIPVFDGHSLRLEQDDGLGRTLLVHCEPDGIDVRGAVVMALDVSELKQAQQEAEQLNVALELERDRANAASGAKSQFLATMSHEIRTPMNAILGMLRLLRRTPLASQQLDYVSKTEGSAKSLLGLLNDILDFSKVEAGKLELESAPFEIDSLLRELSVILAANLSGKPIELVYDIDPALPKALQGDCLRLQQVLINLGGNAIKFTAQGEVLLQLRLLHQEGDRVRLGVAVRDTGIGIPNDKLGAIFEGFSQAEASTTRRFGGTGLGLAISQRLVRLMGGELSAASQVGQGSVFAFDIELAMAEGPALPAPLSQQVLLVERHDGSRTALAGLLAQLGCRVVAVADGQSARQALQADVALDTLVMAAQLADEDGWDCGQALLALRPGLHWVLAGGASLREHLSGRAQGPAAFLVKPVCDGLLREALQAPAAHAQAVASATQQAGQLAGLRLLVVEDNPNNQQVAQELLQAEGARVDLANDGAQALARLRADPRGYDLVLMDMQMPVMDGLSATRAIRADLKLTELPIIAMTANALAADRDACLAAGMNAHVGKPFDLDALVQLLLSFAPAERAAALAQEAGTASPPPSSSTPLPPPPAPARRPLPTLAVPPALQQEALAAGVDLQVGMDRFLGRTELFQRTAQSFARQAQSLTAQLREHSAQNPPDLEAAQQALHSFKGLAATLACERLAHWGAVGEQRTKAGQMLEPEWLAAFDEQLLQGLPLLLSLAQRLHEPAPAPPPVPVQAPDALARLRAQVAAADPGVLTLLAEQRDALAPWLGSDLERLEEALAGLDFAKARAVLDARHPPAA